MNRLLGRWMCLLVLSTLASCATTLPSGSEDAGTSDEGVAVSFDQACQQDSSLVALYDGRQWGLYRCREVMEHLTPGHVVLALGEAEPLTEVGMGSQRYWGSAQELPWDSRPVLTIPWDHQPPLLPSQLKKLEDADQERNKPHEQHHIFPQMFRKFFERKEINIDNYTILLEVMKHRSIHAGPNGGPWNARWKEWIPKHLDAPPEEIFRYAGQLIYEFELFGPVMPYRKRLPQPLPPGYQGP